MGGGGGVSNAKSKKQRYQPPNLIKKTGVALVPLEIGTRELPLLTTVTTARGPTILARSSLLLLKRSSAEHSEGHAPSMCTHTRTCTSTGQVQRGLRERPFSMTPPCRQPHPVFRGLHVWPSRPPIIPVASRFFHLSDHPEIHRLFISIYPSVYV